MQARTLVAGFFIAVPQDVPFCRTLLTDALDQVSYNHNELARNPQTVKSVSKLEIMPNLLR
jgi:hypothetical protein